MTGPDRRVIGPVPTGREPPAYDRLRRRLLWSLPTGLYVLGTRHGHQRNLMTTSWVMQVAMDPKLVAAAVESSSVTGRLLESSGEFALSLLARSERTLVRHFVKPVSDVQVDENTGAGTMQGHDVVPTPAGLPVLALAAGWLECRVTESVTLGSHVLFVGEVVDCGTGAPGSATTGPPGDALALLRMEDTRMNYGG
ncbi:MAG TPA: flavin reductase family protein [Acidimicrobiales bacterium]|nr:flavin reductase family protein [Acidimicrobiales bacterium]